MKNDLLSDVFYCLLASITAFILVPIFMIGSSPEDYRFIDFIIFFKTGFLLAVLLAVFLGLICIILHQFNLRRASKVFSFFAILWVLIVGFFMPVSISAGMVDPEEIPVHWLNVIASIVVVGGLSFAGLTVARKYIKVFIVVVILTSIIPALLSIYRSEIWLSVSKNSHPSLELSSKKNILVISFDGIPGYIVTDLIKENEKYAKTLKDFVVFSNATSQSPATAASQMGEIYGVHDFKSMGKSREDVLKSLSAEGVTDKLLANHVPDSYRHGYINFPAKPISINTSEQLAQQKIDTFDFFRYPITRLWTGKFLDFLNWDSSTIKLRAYPLGSNGSSEANFLLKDHKGPHWEKSFFFHMALFNKITEQLSVGDKNFSVRYLHFLFTHFPVDFDEDCNYRSDNKLWHELHQNDEGLKSQTRCAIDLFSNYIKKIKELGIYDNSLIVFKSDHGEPSKYFSKTPDNLTINGPGLWGYNRYRPTLMVKDFASNSSEVVFKDELVLLNDLAKTLCERSDLKLDCEAFPGVNLLDDDLGSEQPYYLYVSTDAEDSHFKFEDHVSVKISSRKKSLLNSMRDSGRIDLDVLGGNKYKTSKQFLEDYKRRLLDLKTIKTALTKYYEVNKKYPLSKGWNGVYSNWGESSPDYIKGLVPEYLDFLPIDPRNSVNGSKNYIYKSNGKDFKFIIHGAPAYDLDNLDNQLIDPRRPDWAYGVWTSGAENW